MLGYGDGSASTWEVEREESGVQGQPQLLSEFEHKVSYLRLSLKKTKQTQGPTLISSASTVGDRGGLMR